jgi:arabinofuranosyltransferase
MPVDARPAGDVQAGPSAAQARLVDRIPVYLLVGLYLVFVLRAGVLSDDAYITFRTSENLIHGRGLIWNPDERVQAYTHPPWMFLLSGAFAITGEVYYTAIAVSTALSLAAVLLLVRAVASSASAALLAVGVLTFSKAYVDFSTSGLENPLTHLLLFGFLGLWLTTQSRGRPLFCLALLASAVMLNRLDCALLVGPPLVAAVTRARSFRSVGYVLLGLSPLLAWELFSLIYYGFPFPNTAYAKLNNGIPTSALIEQGVFYLVNSIREDAVTTLAITAGLIVSLLQRRITSVAVAIGTCLYVTYVVCIGGDFMSGRLLTPPLAAAAAILAAVPGISPRVAYVGLSICVIGAATAPRGVFRAVGDAGYFYADEKGIADERSWYGPFTGLPERAAGRIVDEHRGVKQARSARQAGERVTVGENAGFLGYVAGDSIHVVDVPALADALLARLPPRPVKRWRIGHFNRDLPAGYLATLESGSNQLEDAGLHEYYDRLRRVISGPLLDGERLREILRFNLGANDHLLENYVRTVRANPPK